MKTEIRKLFLRTGLSIIFFSLVLMPLKAVAHQDWPSTAISDNHSFPFIDLEQKTIADLASMNLDNLNYQITTSQEGRIMVAAQVGIGNPGGTAVRGSCRLYISDGTGPFNGEAELGRPAIFHTNNSASYDLVVAIFGSTLKPAGTYNVWVKCQKIFAGGAITAGLDNMAVWTALHQVPREPLPQLQNVPSTKTFLDSYFGR